MADATKPFELTVYHDEYHDVWSVEGGGDTLCAMYRIDEETHRRIPFHEELSGVYACRLVMCWNEYDTLSATNAALMEEIEGLRKAFRDFDEELGKYMSRTCKCAMCVTYSKLRAALAERQG